MGKKIKNKNINNNNPNMDTLNNKTGEIKIPK